jgi:hypothetical protein
MSAIKAIQILDQIAGLFMELRKELNTMGATTSSGDSMASAFLVSQLQTLGAAAAAAAAPAPVAAAAAASSPKPKSAPKPKDAPVANILTEAQLQEMLAAGVKAQAHTKKLAEVWFCAAKFNIPEALHQAARDQWVAFGKSNGAVRTTRGGHDTWPAPAPASPTVSVPTPVADPVDAPVPVADSVPAPAPAKVQLLNKGRLEQLKSYGTFADSDLDNSMIGWFTVWKVPSSKFGQALVEWREWAVANGVPSKPRDDDGDTVVDDEEGTELNLE